jgi:hypothetical protein
MGCGREGHDRKGHGGHLGITFELELLELGSLLFCV